MTWNLKAIAFPEGLSTPGFAGAAVAVWRSDAADAVPSNIGGDLDGTWSLLALQAPFKVASGAASVTLGTTASDNLAYVIGVRQGSFTVPTGWTAVSQAIDVQDAPAGSVDVVGVYRRDSGSGIGTSPLTWSRTGGSTAIGALMVFDNSGSIVPGQTGDLVEAAPTVGTPTLSNTAPSIGDTVTVSASVTGSPSPTVSYQWKREDNTNIGTNSASYTVASGDAGQGIKCTVTATNLAGSANATSAVTSDIAASGDQAVPTGTAPSGTKWLRDWAVSDASNSQIYAWGWLNGGPSGGGSYARWKSLHTHQTWAVNGGDGNSIAIQVRSGDLYVSDGPVFTDANTSERCELEYASILSNGVDVVLEYDWMLQGAANTANWYVMTQFHAYGMGGNPQISCNFEGDDRLRLITRNGTVGSPTHNYRYTSPTGIARNVWHHTRIEARINPAGNGYFRYVLDGVQLVNFTGVIGYSGQTQTDWRVGVYRREAPETTTMNFKNITVDFP